MALGLFDEVAEAVRGRLPDDLGGLPAYIAALEPLRGDDP